MRDSLSKMITGIQADTIIDEQVEVTRVDLYYRPIYAFKYSWASKQKEAILEVDGLTGECRAGSRVFTEYFGKVLDQSFLFDIGADAVGIFVPGEHRGESGEAVYGLAVWATVAGGWRLVLTG